jgi:hypothetical protein
MNTEPEETAEENPEKEIKIERIPEPGFGGTRERLREVTDDKPVPDDQGIKEAARIKKVSGSPQQGAHRRSPTARVTPKFSTQVKSMC